MAFSPLGDKYWGVLIFSQGINPSATAGDYLATNKMSLENGIRFSYGNFQDNFIYLEYGNATTHFLTKYQILVGGVMDPITLKYKAKYSYYYADTSFQSDIFVLGDTYYFGENSLPDSFLKMFFPDTIKNISVSFTFGIEVNLYKGEDVVPVLGWAGVMSTQSKKYNSSAIGIPLSLGVEYIINETFSLGLGFGYKYEKDGNAYTDYYDVNTGATNPQFADFSGTFSRIEAGIRF